MTDLSEIDIHLHSEPRHLNGVAKERKEKQTEEYIGYTAKVKDVCRKKARHSFYIVDHQVIVAFEILIEPNAYPALKVKEWSTEYVTNVLLAQKAYCKATHTTVKIALQARTKTPLVNSNASPAKMENFLHRKALRSQIAITVREILFP